MGSVNNPGLGWVRDYGVMALLALFGSIARGKEWLGPDGRVIKAKCISELATAVMIGVIAVATGGWLHVALPYVAAFSVLGGWLGPSTVSKLVMQRLGVKLDASDV